MARRRQRQAAQEPQELPEELRRGVARVEDFVTVSEKPPDRGHPDPAGWRRFTAWRRWQAAVEAWGAERGLERPALMAAHYWPSSPLAFDAARTRGRW
ncbi:hypothetical protein ABTZ99_13495 [Actinosynnema sp. NPDC002837]